MSRLGEAHSREFVTRALSAIDAVLRTGRSIAPLSAQPDEQEVVLLPGTVISPVARASYPPFGEITVFEELSPTQVEGLPGDLQALANLVYAALGAAAARPDVVVHSPGKFRDR